MLFSRWLRGRASRALTRQEFHPHLEGLEQRIVPTIRFVNSGGILSATAASQDDYAVAPADFNGDGKLGAVFSEYGNGQVRVYFGDGTGNLAAGTTVGTGASPTWGVA